MEVPHATGVEVQTGVQTLHAEVECGADLAEAGARPQTVDL